MQSLLSAYKREVEGSVPDRDRDWRRLVQRIDAGAEPLPVELDAPARGRWLPWALGAVAAVVLATCGLTRMGRGASAEVVEGAQMARDEADAHATDGALEVSPAEHGAPTHGASPAPAEFEEVGPEPELEPEPEPELEPKPELAPSTSQSRRRRLRRPEPVTPEPEPQTQASESPLIAEARSLRRIRAALRDGRGRAALRAVAAHERAFPQGALSDELVVLEADALCQVGRRGEARTVADAFVRRHPDSPLAARARRICASP
ncbi:MAG: tetratricopeptide repeat protein [Nannocystaceae bacterium]